MLKGECLAIVEEQERRLHTGDFLFTPPGTNHVLVGAGEAPCVILMVGARKADQEVHYPVSPAAATSERRLVRATDFSAGCLRSGCPVARAAGDDPRRGPLAAQPGSAFRGAANGEHPPRDQRRRLFGERDGRQVLARKLRKPGFAAHRREVRIGQELLRGRQLAPLLAARHPACDTPPGCRRARTDRRGCSRRPGPPVLRLRSAPSGAGSGKQGLPRAGVARPAGQREVAAPAEPTSASAASGLSCRASA